MYTNSKKHKLAGSGLLTRPKLTTFKGLYAGKPLLKSANSYGSPEKRKKSKKSTSSAPSSKMDFRRRPDYADNAYREAVGRLRFILAETYTPVKRFCAVRDLDSVGEDTDNQSMVSAGSRPPGGVPYYHYPFTYKRYPYLSKTGLNLSEPKVSSENTAKSEAPPELMSFIERQEEYIEQLERESRYCREELATLLNKVKDVISENEHLHEKQRNKLTQSVFDHLETETETETEVDLKSSKKPVKQRILEGPAIVFESRISELEAQLTQTKIELRKAQEENETYRRKIADGTYTEGPGIDTFKKQLDTLQSEKLILNETINKLQSALEQMKNKEYSTCDQVKRTLDVAEQAQYEKSAAELEIRRLKDELERQHGKLREAIAEQSRRISEERSSVERRYSQQVEQLNAELSVQWETTGKLQLELDKQRRENADLRREIAQKQAQIDELKKEMQNKITNMQADFGVSSAEKSSLENQIATLQLANERNERQYKQEISRLQAEMQSLRQRLDRADADLIHSRRENIRLNEQIASLEKEANLNAALADERKRQNTSSAVVALPAPTTPKKENSEKEVSSLLQNMEAKHAATVAELEAMIHSQNQLMDKLSHECYALTQKLEESSNRHKEEIRQLQTNLDFLSRSFNQSQLSPTKHSESSGNIQTSTQQRQIQENNGRTLARTDSTASSKARPQLPSYIPSSRKQSQDMTNIAQNFSRKPSQDVVISRKQSKDFGSRRESQDLQRLQPQEDVQAYVEPQGYYPDQYANQQFDPNQGYGDQDYNVNAQYDPNEQYGGSYEYDAGGNNEYSNVQYDQYAVDQEQFGNYGAQEGFVAQEAEDIKESKDVTKDKVLEET